MAIKIQDNKTNQAINKVCKASEFFPELFSQAGSFTQIEQTTLGIKSVPPRATKLKDFTPGMYKEKPLSKLEIIYQDILKLSPVEQEKLIKCLVPSFNTEAILENIPETVSQDILEIIKENYTPYPRDQKMTVKNIVAHLEEQLGDYLSCFGANENLIYLDQFRKIESYLTAMYDKLKYEHKNNSSSPVMTDIVPKKSERMTKKLSASSSQNIKDARRMDSVQRWRSQHSLKR